MRDNIDDGGPAFPHPDDAQGLTFRDYFAAKAMQGFIANDGGLPGDSAMTWTQKTALISYAMADAMIAARKT